MQRFPFGFRNFLGLVAPGALLLLMNSAWSKDDGLATYRGRLIEANGIQLQYMDFGGSGLPLIFVQDVHNPFGEANEQEDLWSGFYARFTDRQRVLASVRRGYGESDAPDWGYDVPTQSEDLLGLMDALGIERAVLFGRTTAIQDMIWIAEHHPERLAGLVMLGNPPVFGWVEHPDARTFAELYSAASCDLLGNSGRLLDPRTSWRPHFLADAELRIQVAALRFSSPVYDRESMSVRRIDRLERNLPDLLASQADCPGESAYLDFVRELANNSERRAAIRAAFVAADSTIAIDDGVVRAFGQQLKSVEEPEDLEGWSGYFEFMEDPMREFLRGVTSDEIGRSPDPSGMPEDENR